VDPGGAGTILQEQAGVGHIGPCAAPGGSRGILQEEAGVGDIGPWADPGGAGQSCRSKQESVRLRCSSACERSLRVYGRLLGQLKGCSGPSLGLLWACLSLLWACVRLLQAALGHLWASSGTLRTRWSGVSQHAWSQRGQKKTLAISGQAVSVLARARPAGVAIRRSRCRRLRSQAGRSRQRPGAVDCSCRVRDVGHHVSSRRSAACGLGSSRCS